MKNENKNKSKRKMKWISLFACLVLVVVTGCNRSDKQAVKNGMSKGESVPSVVLNDYFEIASGQKVLDEFIEKTNRGERAKIDIFRKPEDNKEGNSLVKYLRVDYDGEYYWVRYAQSYIDTLDQEEREALVGREVPLQDKEESNVAIGEKYVTIDKYKHIIALSENRTPETGSRERVYYYLVDDDSLTLKQIEWSMLSSQSTDWLHERLLAERPRKSVKVRRGMYVEEGANRCGKYIMISKNEIRMSESLLMSYAEVYNYKIEGDVIRIDNEEKQGEIRVIHKNIIEYQGTRYKYDKTWPKE